MAAATIKVNIRGALLASLQQMWRLASTREALPFESYVGMLLEVAAADFRSTQHGRELLGISPPRTDGKYFHRRKYPT
jgi:hypothetical protein